MLHGQLHMRAAKHLINAGRRRHEEHQPTIQFEMLGSKVQEVLETLLPRVGVS